jgi:hypothetical protein
VAKKVVWNVSHSLVAITTTDEFYVLTYRQSVVKALLASSEDNSDGFDEAFDMLYDLPENV